VSLPDRAQSRRLVDRAASGVEGEFLAGSGAAVGGEEDVHCAVGVALELRWPGRPVVAAEHGVVKWGREDERLEVLGGERGVLEL
jgi:hypothetical protein